MGKEKSADSNAIKFPIIGIGASAGGLEAFEQFLSNVPDNSGMAYVIIQHLDPNQKGMLPELLQRITKMKVIQAKDRMLVLPNYVYVIPPNKSMSILNGALRLHETIEERGLRLPIDYFLRSLAEDRQDRCAGIILSGMGSDGSSGIRAIKERNGIAMVQEPANAKFDSMPRNAIESVLVDIIAPVNELPEKLFEFFKKIPVIKLDFDIENQDKTSLSKIITLLRIQTGNDFSLYKKNTIYRRVERRMVVHKIDKISSYADFLQHNPTETTILFKELLIGVTNFFRDSNVWENLVEDVFPNIIRNKPVDSIIRAWIPGCSTGEEAYSLAMIFKEALEIINPHSGITFQIFATDLDNEAIEIARKGLYPENIAIDVSPIRLSRFFIKTKDGYCVKSEIREMIVFAQHNIVMHPPFTKLDIISCRNLLIYMDNDLQKKIISLFYYSMNPNGILILGNSETVGTQTQLFTSEDVKLKIYNRSSNSIRYVPLDFPSSYSHTKKTEIEKHMPVETSQNIELLANKLLLQHFSPPGVLVNEEGDIIYISGRTGKYLEPAVGKANLNIFAMLRDGLRQEFSSAFHKAVITKETVVIHNIKVGSNGGTQIINVNIQWIDKPNPLKGMLMIIFIDMPSISDNHPLIDKNGHNTASSLQQASLEIELYNAREDMQKTFEEMQTSQEELKSTNEELQSTNEELQSTNEELTSSKEEMQSLNEELQTVNSELKAKIEDFTRVNNDMKNLLNSTEIATLFLEKDLKIRRFTYQATKIFKLIKSDIGRPFTDQVSDLIYTDLVSDAQEVLKTLTHIKKQIPTKDGRWFSIRIMPYRTHDDKIDGLVITFFNITDLKILEQNLHESELMHRIILDTCSDIIIKLSTDFNILEFNHEAEKKFNKKYENVINQNFIKFFIPESHQKQTERELKKLLKNKVETKYKMQVLADGNNISEIEWAVNILLKNEKIPSEILIINNK